MFAKIPLLNKLFASTAEESDLLPTPEVSEGAFRIGVLGAANIAPGAIIEPSLKIKDCVVYGVAARSKEKATTFAAAHNIEKVFDSYEALINSDEIDIVFNPLPNGYHAYYSVLALKKGKHVLCEKPLTSNVTEIATIRKALETAPLNPKTKTKPVIIEAFHDKYHPLFRKILNLTKAKHFGEIEEISVDFLIPWWRISKKDIRFNCDGQFPELGGGTFMDLGCYNTSIFRMIATEDLLVGEDSSKVSLDFRINDSELKEMFKTVKGIDKSLNATVELFKTKKEEGSTEQKEVRKVIGKFRTSFNAWRFSMSFTIKGTKKKMKVTNSLSAHNWHKVEEYDVETKKKTSWTEYGVDKDSSKSELSATYDHQLHHFIETLKGNKESENLCNSIGGLDMATENMKMIDEIYKKAGAQPRLGKKGLEDLVK